MHEGQTSQAHACMVVSHIHALSSCPFRDNKPFIGSYNQASTSELYISNPLNVKEFHVFPSSFLIGKNHT